MRFLLLGPVRVTALLVGVTLFFFRLLLEFLEIKRGLVVYVFFILLLGMLKRTLVPSFAVTFLVIPAYVALTFGTTSGLVPFLVALKTDHLPLLFLLLLLVNPTLLIPSFLLHLPSPAFGRPVHANLPCCNLYLPVQKVVVAVSKMPCQVGSDSTSFVLGFCRDCTGFCRNFWGIF